jgi:serine/threonine-protein kinase
MEWVEGMNLTDYVRTYVGMGERPPWPLACAIAIEVLRALASAHSRMDAQGRPVPVIHRDVTPANILLGVNGSVKLTDFGLARAMDRPRTTDPGTVKGKVAYLAPELLENGKPEARCDLYSLGVVLWETLCAQRLFGGERTDVEIAMDILRGDVMRVDALRAELPAELGEIVARALARTPRARYQRASEMIDALSALLRRLPTPSDGTSLARSVRAAKSQLSKSSSPP